MSRLSDPLDPGGEVRCCSVGFTISMSDIAPFRAAAALNVQTMFPEKKKKKSGGCVLGAAGFRAFLMSEHDRQYVSHYFNPPSVGVACVFT